MLRRLNLWRVKSVPPCQRVRNRTTSHSQPRLSFPPFPSHTVSLPINTSNTHARKNDDRVWCHIHTSLGGEGMQIYALALAVLSPASSLLTSLEVWSFFFFSLFNPLLTLNLCDVFSYPSHLTTRTPSRQFRYVFFSFLFLVFTSHPNMGRQWMPQLRHLRHPPSAHHGPHSRHRWSKYGKTRHWINCSGTIDEPLRSNRQGELWWLRGGCVRRRVMVMMRGSGDDVGRQWQSGAAVMMWGNGGNEDDNDD